MRRMLSDFIQNPETVCQIEARIAAECAIAWLAAQKADSGQKTRLCEAFTQLETAGDTERRRAADSHFHRLLAEIAGNSILSENSRTLMEQLNEKSHDRIYRLDQVPRETDDQHWNIVVAVCANEPEAAEQAMKRHMEYIYSLGLPEPEKN